VEMHDLTKSQSGAHPTEAEIMTCISINLLPFEPWKTTGGGGDDENWGIQRYVPRRDEAQEVIVLTDNKDEETSGLEDNNTSYDGNNMAFEGKTSFGSGSNNASGTLAGNTSGIMEGDLLGDTSFNASDMHAGNTRGLVEEDWLVLDVVALQEEHEVFIDLQLIAAFQACYTAAQTIGGTVWKNSTVQEILKATENREEAQNLDGNKVQNLDGNEAQNLNSDKAGNKAGDEAQNLDGEVQN
jgi:hypothetical protein